MHYEINVTHHGKHYFATDPRSIRDETHLRHVYFDLKTKFPAEHGWGVTVMRWETSGTQVHLGEVR